MTKSLNGPEGFESFVHAQSTLEVNLQAFSEHCLDTTKFSIHQTTKDILRKTYPAQATIQLDSSTETAPNQYKPGGTGILILGRTASRLEPQGRGGDTLGRWSFVSLRRKHFPPVTVISVYQVCPRPTNVLGNTAYHPQLRLLNMAGRTIHPRTAFIEDLQRFIQALRAQDHDIILGGDFNESLQDKNSGILQIATRHNMVDPFLSHFPHHQDFGTHIMGKRRIAYFLVTPGILPCIHPIGYAPYEYASFSDHSPIVMDMNTTLLFGNDTIPFTSPPNRLVKSRDKISVHTFIHHLYDHLQNKDVFKLQSQLDDDSATPQTAANLDEVLGLCEDLAEKKCRARRPEYYSRTIVQQRFRISILKRHLSALRNDQDRTPQLLHKMTQTGVFVALPETQALTRQALHAARLELQTTRQTSFETRQATSRRQNSTFGLSKFFRQSAGQGMGINSSIVSKYHLAGLHLENKSIPQMN